MIKIWWSGPQKPPTERNKRPFNPRLGKDGYFHRMQCSKLTLSHALGFDFWPVLC